MEMSEHDAVDVAVESNLALLWLKRTRRCCSTSTQMQTSSFMNESVLLAMEP